MLSKALARTKDDSGAALMVALIFILVVGLLVTAALSKSGAVLRSNYLVRDTAQVQYGADAGVDRALEVLRNELKANNPVSCASDAAGAATDFGPGDSGGFQITGNSHTMHYTCKTVNGKAKGVGGAIDNDFAIVTTSTSSGALTTSNAVNDGVPVSGAIYMAGREANSDLKKSVAVSNAGFFENFDPSQPGARASCLSSVAALTQITMTTQDFQRNCTAESVLDAMPAFNLPDAPKDTVNPASVDYKSGGKTCRVFLPGKYTGDLDSKMITGDPSKHGEDANYFLSGLYYLTGNSNVGNNQKRIVFGGLPNTSRNDATVGPPMTDTGCADFDGQDLSTLWTAIPAPGSLAFKLRALWATLTPPVATWQNAIWPAGIELVMGKGSSLVISKASMSLASPAPSDSDLNGKRSISFVAARQDKWVTSGTLDSAHYAAWDNTGGTVLDDSSNPGAQLVINGKIVAPDASMAVFASNNSVAVARAGLVAKTVDLAAASSVDPNSFSFQSEDTNPDHGPSPVERTVKITVTVDGSPFTATAIATIDNFFPYQIRVFTWRAG
jgi:Tfp pilus assembly protein PilX